MLYWDSPISPGLAREFPGEQMWTMHVRALSRGSLGPIPLGCPGTELVSVDRSQSFRLELWL